MNINLAMTNASSMLKIDNKIIENVHIYRLSATAKSSMQSTFHVIVSVNRNVKAILKSLSWAPLPKFSLGSHLSCDFGVVEKQP